MINNFKEIDKQVSVQNYAKQDLILQRGNKSWINDLGDSNYLDFTSGIGVNSLGICDSSWVDAVVKQAKELGHVSNLFYNPVTVEFTKNLVEACKMSRAFLCNSGTEANEAAIKIARKYSFDKYGKGRHKIITLNNSFHGRSFGALSATGQDSLHPDCFAPYLSGFVSVEANIKSVEKAIDSSVCAIIIEIVQGEGGINLLGNEFLTKLNQICEQKDILLIVDEVQTGVGRTGEFLACFHYDIRPNIITLAKGLGGGLPIGACLVDEKTKDTLGFGDHGSTFGGNPIVCAGANYVLQTINNKEFLSLVNEKGEYLKNAFLNIKEIKEVRALGLMIGFNTDFEASEIIKRCKENNLLLLTAKQNTVRLLPALTISYEQIDLAVSIIAKVLKELL